MIRKILFYRNYTDTGLLLLRLSIGLMIWMHGIGKLQDLIRGKNDFPDPIGIGSTPSLVLVTFAEFICPLFIIMGLLTRLAALPLMITMAVVVFIHEAHLGLFDKEPPVLFLMVFTGLFFTGAGKYSVDYKLIKRK